ncbi:MAG: hypothetical protein LUD69_07825 [Oscillospiraceae bacterium]|nr:hypothetical protein [Oscillospiraceae bacterium]
MENIIKLFNEEDFKVFENSDFGNLRTVYIDDEPWFVGKDVATALGYADTFGALKKHVDAEDKQNCQNDSFDSPRGMTVINESGLYSLIMSSKLPTAKEFKRWVTSEVLPSVRKHGAYITRETLNQIMTSPDFAIQLFTQIKEEQEKNAELQKENDALKTEVDGLAHNTAEWDKRATLVALMRNLARNSLHSDFRYAFNILYKELRYAKKISLSQRDGDGSLIDRIEDDEWDDVLEVACSICKRHGIDVARVVNEVNAAACQCV